MQITIAPNAFKNSLPADEVAKALREGILQSGFTGSILCCPVGDGGDGTGKILREHLNAKSIQCKTVDPLQRPITATFGLTDDKTAVIELADASGLRLLQPDEYNPLLANTIGTGMMLKAALNEGAKKIILCIGGSATVDGGTGILQALGIRFKNNLGVFIEDLPLGLADLENIDIRGFDQRLKEVKITILCDVKNKLLGTNGAAAVFGPQKGANKFDIKFLEECLKKLDDAAFQTTQKRISEIAHSGAAGGVAAALCAFCNAEAVDGIGTFLEIINFNAQIKNSDLIITGEGEIDNQTLDGKAPFGVSVVAKKCDVPVIAVAGNVEQSDELKKYFDALICINPAGITLNEAIRNTRQNLLVTGKSIGKRFIYKKRS